MKSVLQNIVKIIIVGCLSVDILGAPEPQLFYSHQPVYHHHVLPSVQHHYPQQQQQQHESQQQLMLCNNQHFQHHFAPCSHNSHNPHYFSHLHLLQRNHPPQISTNNFHPQEVADSKKQIQILQPVHVPIFRMKIEPATSNLNNLPTVFKLSNGRETIHGPILRPIHEPIPVLQINKPFPSQGHFSPQNNAPHPQSKALLQPTPLPSPPPNNDLTQPIPFPPSPPNDCLSNPYNCPPPKNSSPKLPESSQPNHDFSRYSPQIKPIYEEPQPQYPLGTNEHFSQSKNDGPDSFDYSKQKKNSGESSTFSGQNKLSPGQPTFLNRKNSSQSPDFSQKKTLPFEASKTKKEIPKLIVKDEPQNSPPEGNRKWFSDEDEQREGEDEDYFDDYRNEEPSPSPPTDTKKINQPFQFFEPVSFQTKPDDDKPKSSPFDSPDVSAALIPIYKSPITLLPSRFPPKVEELLERIQNYFSTYNQEQQLQQTQKPIKNTPSTTVSTTVTTTVSPTTPLPNSNDIPSTSTNTEATAQSPTTSETEKTTTKPMKGGTVTEESTQNPTEESLCTPTEMDVPQPGTEMQSGQVFENKETVPQTPYISFHTSSDPTDSSVFYNQYSPDDLNNESGSGSFQISALFQQTMPQLYSTDAMITSKNPLEMIQRPGNITIIDDGISSAYYGTEKDFPIVTLTTQPDAQIPIQATSISSVDERDRLRLAAADEVLRGLRKSLQNVL